MNEVNLKPYAFEQFGNDGRLYGLILMATPEQVAQCQAVGILPADVRELVGMQTAVDTQVAMLERDMPGVKLQ